MLKRTFFLTALIITLFFLYCRIPEAYLRKEELPEKLIPLLEEADSCYRNKHDIEKLKKGIELYEEIIEQYPGHYHSLRRASELYHAMGYVVLRDEPDAVRREKFKRGRELGFQALYLNKRFARAAKRKTVRASVGYINKEEVDALFWAAVNWARWGEMKGLVKVAVDLPNLKAMMKRVIELDETFYHGGAHSFFGVLYSYLPQIAGKDLEKARKHFEKCEEIDPAFLMTYVVKAEYYAYYAMNPEMYKNLLNKVIKYQVKEKDNEHLLEDKFAKEHAAVLLEQFPDKFPDAV